MKLTNNVVHLQTIESSSSPVVAPIAATDDVDPDIVANFKVGHKQPNNAEIRKWYVQLLDFRSRYLVCYIHPLCFLLCYIHPQVVSCF